MSNAISQIYGSTLFFFSSLIILWTTNIVFWGDMVLLTTPAAVSCKLSTVKHVVSV